MSDLGIIMICMTVLFSSVILAPLVSTVIIAYIASRAAK
jgi:hypothetical protein